MHTTTIVFIGPSLPSGEAVPAEISVRPPIRRGDLDELCAAGSASGLRVGIVDGEFHQSLAISPREILRALQAGVPVFGSSSMGALRAAELCSLGMVGIGRIFEMYRDEEIMSDDEVALLFDGESKQALSDPLVNIRCSVARAKREALISADVANAIVGTASRMHYLDRRYRTILRKVSEERSEDLGWLAPHLIGHDQKAIDARLLLQRIMDVDRGGG